MSFFTADCELDNATSAYSKSSMIWVSFEKEGIHCYPEAATNPELATGDQYDVSFLASKHRHMFHFKVWISVEHANRAIEFIQFKRWLLNLYNDGILQLDYKSCEMMAEDLHSQISTKYPGREVWIDISEDGENGAFLQFKPRF